MAVFYLAFLPQFISPGDWLFGKSMLLAFIHWVEGILWLSIEKLVIVTETKADGTVITRERRTTINWAMKTCRRAWNA